jgi:hypothetical protein
MEKQKGDTKDHNDNDRENGKGYTGPFDYRYGSLH